tara:strand:- start:1447 stop:1956 length:510 start_codon:yes stop_codon:yes gene_type:complete
VSYEHKISEADGGHAVYLAARHDPRLQGKLKTTSNGKLSHNGDKLNEEGLANISVYLTGKYGIRPTRWELYSGLVAAAASSPKAPRKKRETHIEKDYLDAIAKWLEGNANRNDGTMITTNRIGEAIDPDGMAKSKRAAEMKIAAALRKMGYKSKRMMINGTRQYRWFLS